MTRTLEWVAPDGIVLPLRYGDSDVFASGDVTVTGGPPVRATFDTVPLQSGSRLRYVDHGPREVAIPVVIDSDTLAELEATLDVFTHATNPARGEGRLRVHRHDGSVRELVCLCAQSFPIVEPTSDVPTWESVLALIAADPYYYDLSDSSLSITIGGTTGTAVVPFSDPGVAFDESAAFDAGGAVSTGTPPFFPFFPLRLGGSEVLSTFTLTNSGQVSAWPVWTITGPAQTVEVTNETTGERFELTADLAPGETLTIDTRPGRKVIVDQSGEQVFPITGDSSLWAFAVGLNVISATLAGSTAASSVQARWRRRWLSA